MKKISYISFYFSFHKITWDCPLRAATQRLFVLEECKPIFPPKALEKDGLTASKSLTQKDKVSTYCMAVAAWPDQSNRNSTTQFNIAYKVENLIRPSAKIVLLLYKPNEDVWYDDGTRIYSAFIIGTSEKAVVND